MEVQPLSGFACTISHPPCGAGLVQRQGWVVWITGLPGSGKSVVARAVQRKLLEKGVRSQILSSDELRRFVTPKPTYSQNERDAVYGTLAFVASLLARNGVNIIIDATGNLRKYREESRNTVERFAEVYLKCPLEICMDREATRVEASYAPKGIYEKALRGRAPTVPGMGSPYEEPLKPEAVVESNKLTPEECADTILNQLHAFLLT